MQARTAYACLLALGAVLHLALLFKPPSRGHLAFYICWLLISAACAAFVSARSSGRPPHVQQRRIRQATPKAEVDNLWVFGGIAAIGLLIHLFGPYEVTRLSRHRVLWSQSIAMTIMFVLCAAGCWGLLRGNPGDTTAPIPDGSPVVRIGSWLRRSAGVALAGWGLWMLVLGARQWGQAPGGVDRMINLVFVVGGALMLLLGLAIALRGSRSGT
ncbi:hypothetical protein [Roseateles sp. MS654]|uniref:hypothetical protein n=1 Tax=Roseateles sp. MS654 TaxID=3412685 RepID=UPI003C302F9A